MEVHCKTFADWMRKTQTVGLREDRGAVEAAWRRELSMLGLGDARLLWRKPTSPACRTYLRDGLVYKLSLAQLAGQQVDDDDLEREYRVIACCDDLRCLPDAVGFRRLKTSEMAIYRKLEAKPLHEVSMGFFRGASVLLQLAVILVRLSWRGIAHNDVALNNLMITAGGQLYLIDFGKAFQCSRAKAFYRNMFKFKSPVENFYGSYLQVIKSVVEALVPDWVGQLLRRVHHAMFAGKRADVHHAG